MHQAKLVMRVLESGAKLPEPTIGLLEAKPVLRSIDLQRRQRPASNIFAGDRRNLIITNEFVNARNRGVRQKRAAARLLFEPLEQIRNLHEARWKKFERD